MTKMCFYSIQRKFYTKLLNACYSTGSALSYVTMSRREGATTQTQQAQIVDFLQEHMHRK